MATITSNGAKGHHKFTLTVTENSTSTPNNTSSVSYKFVLSPIQTSWNWEDWGTSISYTVNINGTKYTGSIPNYDGYSSITLKSGSLSIGHNSDGSKTISISFSVSDGAGQYYTCGNASASGSMTLTKIPRASSFSIPSSVEVGKPITATISRASSSFTHRVEFYFYPTENGRYDSTSSGWGTSRTFTIPQDWLNGMPNSTSRTAYCAVTTYNGNTQIGDRIRKEFTVKVPDNIKPTVGTLTLDPVDIGGNNVLIQNKNKLAIKVSGCSAGTGSSIKSYVFSGPGVSTTTTSTSITGGPFSQTGDLKYTVKVTDSRGRTASKDATITCHPYNSLSFKSFSASRIDLDEKKYIEYKYDLNFPSVDNTNKVSVTISYKKSTDTKYSSITIIENTTSTSGGGFINIDDTDASYIVYATVTDIYGGRSASRTITVFGAPKVFNVRPTGTGIAFGKKAETDELFECKWNAQFDGELATDSVTITNGPVIMPLGQMVDYVIEQGTSDGWNYTKWANGKIEVYGTKSLTFKPESTVLSSGFYRAIATFSLGSLMEEVYGGFVSYQNSGQIPQIVRNTATTTTVEVIILFATNQGTTAFTIDDLPMYIIGRWK